MNIVETQPATLPLSSFPISDVRPYHSHPSSRQSSKENKTPESTPEASTERLRRDGRDERDRELASSTPTMISAQVAGQKRLANGSIKRSPPQTFNTHKRNSSTTSNVSSGSMKELSQQLRTRLTYAMVKVQNGWQNRSLDEVESLASHSPKSTTLSHMSDGRPFLSPRAALSAHLHRHHSSSSSGSDLVHKDSVPRFPMSPPVRGGLAPSVDIISHQRKRQSVVNAETILPVQRPAPVPRTASQNAVLEADAVETLMFMASPNISGNTSSQFSPATPALLIVRPPAQTSPSRYASGSATSPKRVSFVSDPRLETRDSMLDSLVERVDQDGGVELEQALEVMDRHRATKIVS